MKYFVLQIFLFASLTTVAQRKIPVIKANSRNVNINDDGFFEKDAWYLSPETKPDIYVADRAPKAKFVTFYTDIDSIKVKVKPGSVFDFVILLNEKDSCFTRIVSSKTIENVLQKSANKVDTIPFTLTKYDAIHLKSIINNNDTLNLHFDIGTLGFRFTKDALSRFKKQQIQKIQMGSLVWNKPTIFTANNVAHEMEGRFGWQAFDEKIVEIDYDKKIILVHTKLPKHHRGFVKSRIHFIQSLFCVEAKIQIDNKNYTGNFLYDTGSDLSMVLDSTWMSIQNFPTNQKILKKSSFSDGAGRKYETTTVTVPLVKLNGFKLQNVSTSMLSFKSPAGSQLNYFGNALLKRFNCIIDLQTDQIYLKPNNLYSLPFKEKDN